MADFNSTANSAKKESRVTILNRNSLTITGLDKVFSANSNTIFGAAAGSNFQITGNNLSVTKLDINDAILEVAGKIDGLKYVGTYTEKRPFRLFRRK